MPRRRLPVIVVVGLVLTSAALGSEAGLAQAIDQNLVTTNGPVYAIVRDGGTIYIGGAFTQMGSSSPSLNYSRKVENTKTSVW